MVACSGYAQARRVLVTRGVCLYFMRGRDSLRYGNMPRYRAPKPARTEEQSRRLKIDVKKIPEWEAQLTNQVIALKSSFPLQRIAAAWRVIIDAWPAKDEEISKWKGEIDDWLIKANPDELESYSTRVISGFYRDPSNLAADVKTALERCEKSIADAKDKGVSSSGLSQLFLGKFDPKFLQECLERRTQFLSIIPKLQNVAKANNYLNQVKAKYEVAYRENGKIHANLWKAYEKKRAIEDHEKKHGNVLAKAASVDKSTRSRAGSLKRVVPLTDKCPYCAGELGEIPHLDHIYPVHMGGLSSLENLVWCCAHCNVSKGGKGLILFLREQGLPFELVIERLHALGKHV